MKTIIFIIFFFVLPLNTYANPIVLETCDTKNEGRLKYEDGLLKVCISGNWESFNVLNILHDNADPLVYFDGDQYVRYSDSTPITIPYDICNEQYLNKVVYMQNGMYYCDGTAWNKLGVIFSDSISFPEYIQPDVDPPVSGEESFLSEETVFTPYESNSSMSSNQCIAIYRGMNSPTDGTSPTVADIVEMGEDRPWCIVGDQEYIEHENYIEDNGYEYARVTCREPGIYRDGICYGNITNHSDGCEVFWRHEIIDGIMKQFPDLINNSKVTYEDNKTFWSKITNDDGSVTNEIYWDGVLISSTKDTSLKTLIANGIYNYILTPGYWRAGINYGVQKVVNDKYYYPLYRARR